MKNLYHTICALFILTIAFNSCKLDAPVTPVKKDIIAIKGYHAPTDTDTTGTGTDPGTGTNPDDPGTGTNPTDPGSGGANPDIATGSNKGEGLALGAANTVVIQVDGKDTYTFKLPYLSFYVKALGTDPVFPFGSTDIFGFSLTGDQFSLIVNTDKAGTYNIYDISLTNSKYMLGKDKECVVKITALNYRNTGLEESKGTFQGTFNGIAISAKDTDKHTIKGSFNFQ